MEVGHTTVTPGTDSRLSRQLLEVEEATNEVTRPFVDESTPTGKVYPRQISRSELFNYIESELKAIESDLKTPKAGDYGRADQAAAWALLSRISVSDLSSYLGVSRQNLTLIRKRLLDE